jgi:hypothetical protein
MKTSVLLSILALCAVLSPADEGRLSFDLSGTLGYYVHPDEINGNMTGYYYDYGHIVSAPDAAGGSPSVYSSQTYKYRHSVSSDIRPNAGFGFSAGFRAWPSMGLGIEYGSAFSMADETGKGRYSDTVNTGGTIYSTGIPYSYYIEDIVTEDLHYIKSSRFGAFINFRRPLNPKFTLEGGLGFGMAYYVHHFRIEYVSLVNRYFAAAGNEVFRDSTSPHFSAFEISYEGFYVKPRICAEYRLGGVFSLISGLAFPVSYIEKGYDTQNRAYNSSREAVFYPSSRFLAGNLELDIALRIHFPEFKQKSGLSEGAR